MTAERQVDDPLDIAVADTFAASDPPSFMAAMAAGAVVGAPHACRTCEARGGTAAGSGTRSVQERAR
jgi:hypothetical protein